MKLSTQFCGGLLALVLAASALGQGTFQNLDFESASLPLVHLGGSFDFVASSNSIPGWKGYLGTNQVNEVLNNNYFGGTATVGLLGPGWTNTLPGILGGAYTVILQAGLDLSIGGIPVDAAITQSSLIPISARSLLFEAEPFQSVVSSRFAVSLNGRMINMVALTNTLNYTLYGGDITAFAGLNLELRIAALATPTYPFSAFAFDSIAFSPEAIPEPGAFSLFGLGALFFSWRLSRKARS